MTSTAAVSTPETPLVRPNWFKQITVGTALLGTSLLLLGAASYLAGARINTTRSIPVGLYWASNAPIVKNAYAMFCPTQNAIFAEAKTRGYITTGLCPGGYGYLMKKILAAKNDTVLITPAGVRVNGVLLPLSVPVAIDPSGRPLPHHDAKAYTLSTNQVLMMSDVNGKSFDGRYFGPIDIAQIQTVIIPVFTW